MKHLERRLAEIADTLDERDAAVLHAAVDRLAALEADLDLERSITSAIVDVDESTPASTLSGPHEAGASIPHPASGNAAASPVSPLVRSYLCGLATTRVQVRIRGDRGDRRGTLIAVDPRLRYAVVLVGRGALVRARVTLDRLLYVIDPTDPREAHEWTNRPTTRPTPTHRGGSTRKARQASSR